MEILEEFTYEGVRRELLGQLRDSLSEEKKAVDVYRRRANYARRGYPEIAETYDHLRKEEEQHIKELQDLADKLRRKWRQDG